MADGGGARPAAVDTAGGDDGAGPAAPPAGKGSSPAPVRNRFPSLPLDDLKDFPYNHKVNLDYPGLQCVYRAQVTGAPVFIVRNFLSDAECDVCLAKCTGRLLLSKTTRGVIRTSSHVRVAREETPGLHQRLANLTARTVDSLESAKIIRYQKGHHFGKHCDITAAHVYGGVATLDGREAPAHTNREVTCFIYLNDVAEGGETAFYQEAVHINGDGSEVIKPGKEADGDFSEEVLRIQPERGMLVMFFPTAQPPNGELPPLTAPGNQMLWPFPTEQKAFVYDDMWHTGCPAVDEKYLLAVWAWPPYVDVVKGKTYDGINREDRPTDGVIL